MAEDRGLRAVEFSVRFRNDAADAGDLAARRAWTESVMRRSSKLRALRAGILSFAGDPYVSGREAVRYREDGLVVIEDGAVRAVGDATDLLPDLPADVEAVDRRGCIALAGLVDAHVHYPQTEVIASRAQHLLEWLERHTFPAEIRFADPDHAAAGASFFLDQMLAAGTTTATVFCATAPASADALFAAAETRGLRIVAGKTWMDRNAPAALLDDPESAEADSRALMARWHGRGRLGYAITPRFAITSTPEQLRRAGALAREYPDAWVHSHISESAEEIDAVAELFPEDEDYTSVYARYGLLRKRALYAHGIHLSESELRRFHETGAALVHCPGANTFLGSGLMDLAAARKPDRPVAVGLGSDVGGGTRLSMLCNMAEAFKVAQLRGETLDPFDLFHMATRGGAIAMGLEGRIGNLATGMEADLVVLDAEATGMLRHRTSRAVDIADVLFALIMLGDERAVRETWVAGEPAFAR